MPPMYSPRARRRRCRGRARSRPRRTARRSGLRGDSVHEPVGADLGAGCRSGSASRSAAPGRRRHPLAQEALGHRRPLRREPRTVDDTIDASTMSNDDSAQAEQVAQRRPQLVGRRVAHRGEAPVLVGTTVPERPEMDLCPRRRPPPASALDEHAPTAVAVRVRPGCCAPPASTSPRCGRRSERRSRRATAGCEHAGTRRVGAETWRLPRITRASPGASRYAAAQRRTVADRHSRRRTRAPLRATRTRRAEHGHAAQRPRRPRTPPRHAGQRRHLRAAKRCTSSTRGCRRAVDGQHPARTVTVDSTARGAAEPPRGTCAISIVALPRSAGVTVSSETASPVPHGPRNRADITAPSALFRKPPSSAESRIVAPARPSISGAHLETSTTCGAAAPPRRPRRTPRPRQPRRGLERRDATCRPRSRS